MFEVIGGKKMVCYMVWGIFVGFGRFILID